MMTINEAKNICKYSIIYKSKNTADDCYNELFRGYTPFDEVYDYTYGHVAYLYNINGFVVSAGQYLIGKEIDNTTLTILKIGR